MTDTIHVNPLVGLATIDGEPAVAVCIDNQTVAMSLDGADILLNQIGQILEMLDYYRQDCEGDSIKLVSDIH